jgi:CPA2 family monovalent cation:H+ antiporter-2
MILLSAHMDPRVIKLIGLSIGLILLIFTLKLLKQPYVIAYICAGLILGPYGFEYVTDDELIEDLGPLGIILLFFLLEWKLISNWEKSLIGTLLQAALRVLITWAVGCFLEWKLNLIVTMGFIIILSSSAAVIKLLQDSNEMETSVGENALGILLVQDILIVPMLNILNYLSGQNQADQK